MKEKGERGKVFESSLVDLFEKLDQETSKKMSLRIAGLLVLVLSAIPIIVFPASAAALVPIILTTVANAAQIVWDFEGLAELPKDLYPQGWDGSTPAYQTITLKAGVQYKPSMTSFQLTVHVKDSSGGVLPGASVRLDGILKGYADSGGQLTMSGVSKGLHKISASKAGYLDNAVTVNVLEDKSITLTLNRATTKTYSLTAYVRDAKTKKAIAGASVYLDGAYGGITDSAGKIVIKSVAGGTHLVKAIKTGYRDGSKTISVFSNTSVLIYLTR